MTPRTRPLHAALAALAFLIAGPALAAGQPYTKADTYKNPAIKSGGEVSLRNLAGKVSLVPADDGVLSIDSSIVATGSSDQDSQTLAGKIKIEITASGNSVEAVAHYPLDEYTRYFYPRGNVFGMSTTNTDYEGERVTISDGTFGSGANVHVDFVVHVPKGVKVAVDNKVGRIDANKVNAPLTLKSGSGDIKGAGNSNSLEAHTGSGDITLSDHEGALDVETGSGDVEIDQVKHGDVKAESGSGDLKLHSLTGILTAETGSGDIDVRQFNGSGMDVKTGSGGIKIDSATGSLKAGAGSGDITVTGYKAGEAVECETGSGSVNIDGDLGAVVRLSADSGSGDIVVHTSTVPSLHISATSDSGDVNVDLPGMQNVSAHSHSIRADVNGAKGSAQLEAGSGDVTFTKH